MIYGSPHRSKNTMGHMGNTILRCFVWHSCTRIRRMCVEYVDSDSGERKNWSLTAVAQCRVTNFPGLMGRFAPGAELVRDDLRLVCPHLRPIALWHAAYFMRICRTAGAVPGIVATARKGPRVTPENHKRRALHEADGEFLGGLPVKISAVPAAFTLLMRKID